ncbi:MAG TPA: hypothetical protein VID47_02575 [Actinomycetota bacterium]
MSTPSRLVMVAEMQGRDLMRRHVALGLLVALPVCFYLALAGRHETAVVPGGIATAFSIGGAAIFAVQSARGVDRRLVLAGYHPAEIVLGRLAFLEVLALPLVAAVGTLMALVSTPVRPFLLGLAVELVAITAVPFGLAVGSLLPKELEATLVLIGVVGIQLSLDTDATLSRLLPFYGAHRLIDISTGDPGSVWAAVGVSLLYAAGLTALALLLMARRVRIERHSPMAQPAT